MATQGLSVKRVSLGSASNLQNIPSVGKKPCKFGFKPSLGWKKDACTMCGFPESAHLELAVGKENTSSAAAAQLQKTRPYEEKRKREAEEKRIRDEVDRVKREEEEKIRKIEEEKERVRKEEEERIRRIEEEKERLRQEEEERIRREEEERIRKEEEQRLRREEAERLRREEEERFRREEEERLRLEEEERVRREEEDRIFKELEERYRLEELEKIRLETEERVKKIKEEVALARLEEEKRERSKRADPKAFSTFREEEQRVKRKNSISKYDSLAKPTVSAISNPAPQIRNVWRFWEHWNSSQTLPTKFTDFLNRPQRKKACKFGFKPHPWKKDTCSVCTQPQAAHETS